MPLAPSGLQSTLASNFANPGATIAACAQQWADAVEAYASGVIPASTTVSAAAATLEGALITAFGSPAAAPGMEAAFTAFGAAVGAGMVGYTPVPPAGPVGFAAQFTVQPPTHAAAATAISGLIDTWMRTGSSTLIAPPNTVVPWT